MQDDGRNCEHAHGRMSKITQGAKDPPFEKRADRQNIADIQSTQLRWCQMTKPVQHSKNLHAAISYDGQA